MHMVFLPGEVRKVFPGGWEEKVMLQKINQGFIDYRNKKQSCWYLNEHIFLAFYYVHPFVKLKTLIVRK